MKDNIGEMTIVERSKKEKARMEKYIVNTDKPRMARYDITVPEIQALAFLLRSAGIFEALSLAFYYGSAKGYRMAKAEVRA